VTTEEHREAGPVHVGIRCGRGVSLDAVLSEAGLTGQARRLTEVMALNRLVDPLSEHAMPDWIRRTAMADVLGLDFKTLTDEALYRNLDKLHPQRVIIEQKLAAREKTAFSLDDSLYLYDLTSTYFEGQCALNPQAKRGYSRDQRRTASRSWWVWCLIATGSQGPRGVRREPCRSHDARRHAHEPGETHGPEGWRNGGRDRGMAFADNLKEIKDRGLPLHRGGASGWQGCPPLGVRR